MAKRFLTPLNLPNLASNPQEGAEGDLYFNTVDSSVKIYIDGNWINLQGSGSVISGGGGSVVGGTNINVNYDQQSNTYTVNTNSDLENIDSISTPKFIEFDTSFSPSASLPTGYLYWHEEHQTLHLSLENEVELDIGQEENYPPVFNNSGVQINRGDLVMVTGVQGDKLTVAKAVSDGTVDFEYIIGIAAHDIPNTSDRATIIKFGYVSPVNTNSYDVGTLLYPDRSVPGGLTNILPDAPGYKVPVAIVTKQGTGGKILVRMSLPSRLGESDSNVEFTNLENEDLLVYNSASSIWVNTSSDDIVNSRVENLFIHDNHNNITAEYVEESGEIVLSASASGGIGFLSGSEVPSDPANDGTIYYQTDLDGTKIIQIFTYLNDNWIAFTGIDNWGDLTGINWTNLVPS
jgi:hypothetical protein